MKIFKFKFTKLNKILIYVGLALAAVGLGVSIFNLCTGDALTAKNLVYPIIQYTLLLLIPVAFAAILIGLLISSYYSIDDKFLKTSFGFIKSSYKIEEITAIILDRDSNKLSVYFGDTTYIVINVNEDWYEDFINTLLEKKPSIEYTINSKENNGEDKK
jgi:hypothetical protein